MLHSRAYQVGDFGTDLVEAVLDTVTALARPDAIALYAFEGETWRLVRAENAVELDMDAPSRLTEREREALEGGIPVVLRRGPVTLILPAAARGRLAGVLLMRPVPGLTRFPRRHVPALVALLTRGLDELRGRGVSVPGEDELSADDAAERETLLAHLVASEWNVARVARSLGVTRMTVYNRMRRLRVPRERVRKSDGRVLPGGTRG